MTIMNDFFAPRRLVLGLAMSSVALLPACMSQDERDAQNPDDLDGVASAQQDVSSPLVFFAENFFADGDGGQCGGRNGTQLVSMENFTEAVRIDTDNRGGGCQQQFGVFDPTGVVSGLALNVNFFADGDAGQCGSPGNHPIPVGPTLAFSSPYRIDTDDRGGGCQQVFSLSGRNDVGLDIEFLPDGDAGQCGNIGTFTVTSSNSVAFRLDTDSRGGGCTQRFRLRGL